MNFSYRLSDFEVANPLIGRAGLQLKSYRYRWTYSKIFTKKRFKGLNDWFDWSSKAFSLESWKKISSNNGNKYLQLQGKSLLNEKTSFKLNSTAHFIMETRVKFIQKNFEIEQPKWKEYWIPEWNEIAYLVNFIDITKSANQNADYTSMSISGSSMKWSITILIERKKR